MGRGAPLSAVSAPAPPAGRQPNLVLVGTGAAIFLAAWVPGLIIGESRDNCGAYAENQGCYHGRAALMVPVVGPLLSARYAGSDSSPPFVLWSLAEGAGLAMLVAGIVGHHPAAEQHATSTWNISPVSSRDTTGFILRATF